MRILFLTHSFNSLTQRLYVELTGRGHEVSIEFDIHPEVSVEAVALYRPDLILAPFLKRAIPEAIWKHHLCLVVHPGIRGDRGPSSLDWAIMDGEREWGVTVLQADAEMDAGDVWAAERFAMREAPKASLYRNEVTEAAVAAVLAALDRYRRGAPPSPIEADAAGGKGRWRPAMRQAERAIDWRHDGTAAILRKIHAGDGHPGVLDCIDGEPYFLYGAHREDRLRGTTPGAIIAQRHGAICRATIDGAVWITHLRGHADGPALKLPAALVLGDRLKDVPEPNPPSPPLSRGVTASSVVSPPLIEPVLSKVEGGGRGGLADGGGGWREIRYEEAEGVGYLHFDFHNGAMSTAQCHRLLDAWHYACSRPTRVIVLMGGRDFWCNGIHLNVIEAAESPAEESWRNITAMDDLAQAILTTDSHLTLAAMQGNAGAGGVFLALAADFVYAREGVVLNPHYKNMGNLYGSEFWTYLLPQRVGAGRAGGIVQNRLPIGASAACDLGLIDGCMRGDREHFISEIRRRAQWLAAPSQAEPLLARKRENRRADEARKPLQEYRREELEKMRLNFYGFDPSYHVARYNFVYKVGHSWTPLHLALHRRPAPERATAAGNPA